MTTLNFKLYVLRENIQIAKYFIINKMQQQGWLNCTGWLSGCFPLGKTRDRILVGLFFKDERFPTRD